MIQAEICRVIHLESTSSPHTVHLSHAKLFKIQCKYTGNSLNPKGFSLFLLKFHNSSKLKTNSKGEISCEYHNKPLHKILFSKIKSYYKQQKTLQKIWKIKILFIPLHTDTSSLSNMISKKQNLNCSSSTWTKRIHQSLCLLASDDNSDKKKIREQVTITYQVLIRRI